MKITTNNVPRQMVYGYQLPKELRADFDYLSDDDFKFRDFVKYKGMYFDVYDMQRIVVGHRKYMDWAMAVDVDNPLAKWSAFISETFFSGVLFRFCEDGDGVVCGRYST